MSWIGFLTKLLDIFPFLENWIDLQKLKQVRIDAKFNEKTEIRIEDNKQELIKEEIQTERKQLKKEKKLKKIERKRNKRNDKD